MTASMHFKLGPFVTYFQQSPFADFYRERIGFYKQFSTLAENISGHKKVVAIAKAASIKDIQPFRLNSIIKNYDYRVIVNSVDLNQLSLDNDISFDTQITTRVDSISGISPVLPCELLDKYNVKNLCVNSKKQYKNGLSLHRYYNIFKSYNKKFLNISAHESLISDNPQDYSGHGLTIVAPLINECLASKSVESLCLLGVDFFGSAYLDMLREKDISEENIFYNLHACSSNPRDTHGLPLLRYINQLVCSKKCPPRFKIELPREVINFIPEEIKTSLLSSNHFSLI